jgi:peptidyl-prolyl cis-trans isomerase SurA
MILALLLTFNLQAKLLDKVVGVINEKIFTLSELERVQTTIESRKEISPLVYSKAKYSKEELLDIHFKTYIIRNKLSEQGFIISDDKVEAQISQTEKRNGLRREDLLSFLDSKNFTFEEYFETIRETMEYNLFYSRIITPLVFISEQEIKNSFYKNAVGNNALSFKYDLVDFYIQKSRILSDDIPKLPAVLKEYQATGFMPSIYREIETLPIGDISADDLDVKISDILKNTEEGTFSKPVELNNVIHVYFIKKKDLKESNEYLTIKEKLKNDIFMEKAKLISENWFQTEKSNYFINLSL